MWETVEKIPRAGIIESESTKEVAEMKDIKSLGKINLEPLEKVFGKIQTRDIVVTEERLGHIKRRHPEDFALFEKFGADTVCNPDFIIRDTKNKGTVFMIKELPDTNLNVVVRAVLETEDSNRKNSVMTFYRIRQRNLRKLMEKNDILYKKE